MATHVVHMLANFIQLTAASMANTTRALVAREERRPLLGISGDSPSGTLANTENGSSGSDELHRLQLWRLYLSHFLSTWNTRTYEFAAVSV